MPAPLGPMMARISCSRTSKRDVGERLHAAEGERDVLDREDDVADRRALAQAALLRPRRGAKVFASRICRSAATRAGAAVLVTAPAPRRARVSLPVVERVDQRRVLLADEAAAHLARARELVVVGVELLVQDQEAVDLRVGELGLAREVGVHLLDAVADQLVHLGAARRGRCSREYGMLRFSAQLPTASDVDVDERADACRGRRRSHRFLDVREELELVLEVLRREQRAVGELARRPSRGR